MKYVLQLSYGKDSIACLFAIEKLGLPLDRIIHAEVMATKDIPAELPEMMEFKAYAAERIKTRFGIEVETVRQTLTFEDIFLSTFKSGNHIGEIYGWPMNTGCWCTSRLKTDSLNRCSRLMAKEDIRYIGIAADEPERIKRFRDKQNVVMPLVMAGWDEAYCRKVCDDNGMLSPIYTKAKRGGCWFCPTQGIEQLRLLRSEHPEWWALMLEWDQRSITTFDSKGRTLHDYDRRFQMEDEGLIDPNGKRFRWKMVKEEQDADST